MLNILVRRSAVGLGACAVLAGTGAQAQTAAPPASTDPQVLIQAQQRRIDQLEARLRTMEARLAIAPAPAIAQPVAPVAPQVAAPVVPPVAARVPPVAVADIPERVARPPVVRIVQRLTDSEASPPPATGNGEKAGVVFVNGLPRVNSVDGHWWFRPRGRLFLDASTTTGAFAGRNITGTTLGSARLGMEGAVGNVSWALEGEFAENQVVWKSAFVNIRHHLLGLEADGSIGNRFNDRTMDGSVGLGTTPFTDFNTVAATILPRRGFWGVGLQERLYGPNWHASVQVTGEDPNNIGDGDDGLTVVSRMHWNPIKSKGLTVHLGGWGFHERLGGETGSLVRASAIAGGFNTLVRAQPGPVTGVDSDTGYGAELAVITGRFWTQNEWGRRTLHRAGGTDLSHDAFSLSAGWFVFGTTSPYDARRGTWARARIEDPVTTGGWGAVALRARYQEVDYRGLPLGGLGRSTTIGGTWYINKITRVLLDVTDWHIANPGDAPGSIDSGQTVNLGLQVQF